MRKTAEKAEQACKRKEGPNTGKAMFVTKEVASINAEIESFKTRLNVADFRKHQLVEVGHRCCFASLVKIAVILIEAHIRR